MLLLPFLLCLERLPRENHSKHCSPLQQHKTCPAPPRIHLFLSEWCLAGERFRKFRSADASCGDATTLWFTTCLLVCIRNEARLFKLTHHLQYFVRLQVIVTKCRHRCPYWEEALINFRTLQLLNNPKSSNVFPLGVNYTMPF